MKAVLISMQPRWCELTASGKKTIEVRKTRPKIDTPFKAYFYCTNSGGTLHKAYDGLHYHKGYVGVTDESCVNGYVIGEFVCDKIITVEWDYFLSDSGDVWGDNFDEIQEKSCLSWDEICKYFGIKNQCSGIGYGWHISALVIYDTPKELSEFYTTDYEAVKKCIYRSRTGQGKDVAKHGGWLKGSYECDKSGETAWCYLCKTKALTRPPQSWCYVESGYCE